MRAALLSLLALTSVGAAGIVSATPAAARDYAYCLQGRQQGYPGDCNYATFEQCQATASGRDATCGVNPMVAFARGNGQGEGQGRRGRRAPQDQGYGYGGGYGGGAGYNGRGW